MIKFFDMNGKELSDGDGYVCTPRATIHHDAVLPITHHEHHNLTNGYTLDWDVVDKPGVTEWDEVTEYTCTPIPAFVDAMPTFDKRISDVEAALIELASSTANNETGLNDIYSAITELGNLVAAENEVSNG